MPCRVPFLVRGLRQRLVWCCTASLTQLSLHTCAVIRLTLGICCTPVFAGCRRHFSFLCSVSPGACTVYCGGGGGVLMLTGGERRGCGRLTDRIRLVTQLSALHRQVISQERRNRSLENRPGKQALSLWLSSHWASLKSQFLFIESEILASSVTPPAYPVSVPVEPRGLVCCCFTIAASQGACQMPLGFSSSVLQLSLLKLCSLSFVSRRTQGSAEMKMLRTSWKIKGHRRYLLL